MRSVLGLDQLLESYFLSLVGLLNVVIEFKHYPTITHFFVSRERRNHSSQNSSNVILQCSP